MHYVRCECVCVMVSKTCLSPFFRLEDQVLQCTATEDVECIVYLLMHAPMCGSVGALVLKEPVVFQSSSLNMAAAVLSNIPVNLLCITSQNSIMLKVTAKRISGHIL
jgi:hypothetical protein